MYDPDVFVGYHPDHDKHVTERAQRDQEAFDKADKEDTPELKLYNGEAVPEPPPLKEGESAEVGRIGSLLNMMLEAGEPNPDEEWACSNVWKAGSLTLVVGTQQSFKSWSMLDLLYHAADGTNWLDKGIEQYDFCVYVSGEKGAKAVYERLWKLFHDRHDLASRVLVKHRKHGLKFASQAWEGLIEEVHGLPGKRILVVLDTLTSLAPGGYDENNLKDVSKMLDSVRRLQDGDRVDVLLVHHLNAAGSRPRGHSALDGEVDGFVHFDRRGRDMDEVFVRFEPKDGVPTMGSYRFLPNKGMFERAKARALHVANLRHVVQWWMDRNNGEGITMKELRDQFYNGHRYHQVEDMVQRACDELVLKVEERTSMLTNRTANLVQVLSEEEKEHIIGQRRVVETAEMKAEAEASALIKGAERVASRSHGAVESMKNAELGLS